MWTQQAYIKASNTGVGDQFGYSVALSMDGQILAVGAYGEDSNATGIDGNQDDNSVPQAGAVYIFTHAGDVWAQQAYIKASNTNAGDVFGSSIALSEDGDTLAVGAVLEDSNAVGIDGDQSNNTALVAGAVYVFTHSGNGWMQQAYIKASNTDADDQFGNSVELSEDGNTLVVSARYEASSATGIGGNQNNNTALQAGAVYVFTRAGNVWAQQAYIKASNTNAGDSFGNSVGLSEDGNTLAVSAHLEDSSTTGVDGDQGDNSAGDAGAVYVFTRAGDVWTQQVYIKASNTDGGDYFGYSVELSGDGNMLAASAIIETSSATGIGGDQSDNATPQAGAVYVFTREGDVWTQQAYVKAPNTGSNDQFGNSVALSADGNTLAAAAVGEASNAAGIGGNQNDNSADAAGAVYLY